MALFHFKCASYMSFCSSFAYSYLFLSSYYYFLIVGISSEVAICVDLTTINKCKVVQINVRMCVYSVQIQSQLMIYFFNCVYNLLYLAFVVNKF